MLASEMVVDELVRARGGRGLRLKYDGPYQLLVTVVLWAQESSSLVNAVSRGFFSFFPSFSSLASAKEERLLEILNTVRNFEKKVLWLQKLARQLAVDEQVPRSMSGLTKLPGVSRKVANVVLRELGLPAEGIMVDMGAYRVAVRLGLGTTEGPDQMERELMKGFDKRLWGEMGFALSEHAREVCTTDSPRCTFCEVKNGCAYFTSTRSQTGEGY